jgi:hypothetical protein
MHGMYKEQMFEKKHPYAMECVFLLSHSKVRKGWAHRQLAPAVRFLFFSAFRKNFTFARCNAFFSHFPVTLSRVKVLKKKK